MPPPLPFPFPLRIGTDICQINRISKILRSSQGPNFVQRVLTPEELAHLSRKRPALTEYFLGYKNTVKQPAPPSTPGGRITVHTFSKKENAAAARAAEEQIGALARDAAAARVPRLKVIGKTAEQKDSGEQRAEAENEQEKRWEKEVHFPASRWLAGRWAAKEAAFKAHPHLQLGFHDVVITFPLSLPEGKMRDETANWKTAVPMALIRPGEGRPDQMAMISISHDGDYATATCIGFDAARGGVPEPDPDPEPKPEPEPKTGLFSWFSR